MLSETYFGTVTEIPAVVRQHIHEKLDAELERHPALICRSDTMNSCDGQSARGATLWAADAHFSGRVSVHSSVHGLDGSVHRAFVASDSAFIGRTSESNAAAKLSRFSETNAAPKEQ